MFFLPTPLATMTQTATEYVEKTVFRDRLSGVLTVTETAVPLGNRQQVSLTAPLQTNDGTVFAQPQMTLTFMDEDPAGPISTVYIADFGDTMTSITPPVTITHAGTAFPFLPAPSAHPVILMDPSPTYDARPPSAFYTPPACIKGSRHHDKNKCDIQRCMHRFVEPMNFTTAMVAHITDERGQMSDDFVMRNTMVMTPHWGVSESEKTYWPIATVTKLDASHKPTTHAVQQGPVEHDRILPCYDRDSCYNQCETERESQSRLSQIVWIGGLVLLGTFQSDNTNILLAYLARFLS